MKKVIECIPGDGVFVVDIARMVSAKIMYDIYILFLQINQSSILITQLLYQSELEGIVVKDESLQGIKYYKNIF